MCGISGIISKTKTLPLKQAVFGMTRAIKHRGPDGEGFAFFSEENIVAAYSDETPLVNKQSRSFLFNPQVNINNTDDNSHIAFGHCRLSIIDVSEAGHQPMCDVTGKHWIVFNGEIFNYIELRDNLKKKGHTFVTNTDTEVVIEAYKAWGVNCIEKFNGMFAFALFDKVKQQIFCARDRVGVKPFYFSDTSQSFSFASEYKAFIKSGLIKFNINEKQQFDFIVNNNLETDEQSLFAGIKELKPAHYILYNIVSHQYKIDKYYNLPTNNKLQISENEAIQLVEEKLVQSINLRLRSDVEIGACLSGGLDSSVIAGVVKHLQPNKQMKLFTAVFPSQKFDESEYAKLVVDYVNGNWKTVSPTAHDFFDDIETLNYSQDLPVWSTSTYSQHKVMQLASQNSVKVLLDGQGADELFAGYAHHYMALWKENFGVNIIQDIYQSKQTVANGYQMFTKQLLKDVFNLSVDYSRYFNADKKMFGKSGNEKLENSLNAQLAKDYKGKLKSFLKCEDRCSMAFGIESRVPFADDVELVDLLFGLKGNMKIRNGVSKYLLRQAAKNYIPQQIYMRRDKIGFEAPVNQWLVSRKLQILDTIKANSDFVNVNFLHANFDKLLNDKPGFLFRLYSFSVWKNVYKSLNSI